MSKSKGFYLASLGGFLAIKALSQLVDQVFFVEHFPLEDVAKVPPPCAKVKALRSAERYVVVRNRWASQVLAFMFP